MIFIKNIIFYLIGLIPTSLLKKNIDFSERVLFVHLSHPLGDFISRINFLRSVDNENSPKNCFLIIDEKYKKIAHLIESKFELLFVKRIKYKLNPFYRFKILKYLTSLKFKLAFNISVDRGMMSDEITINSRANRKITLQKENHFLSSLFENINDKKYSDILSFNSFNEYERMEELKYILREKFGFDIKESIIPQKTQTGEKYIVIAPFSSKKNKSWPFESYLQLIQKLTIRARIFVIGETKNISHMRILKNIPGGVTNLVCKTKIEDVTEVIRGSSLFIGNDSGLTHLAYFFRIPLIGIIGGGSYGFFFPNSNHETNLFFYNPLDCFNCNWRCKYSEPYCLTKVTVDSVYNSALKLLDI